MLEKNPSARITAQEALLHEFFDDSAGSFEAFTDKTAFYSQQIV
jgi:hypothetical protein